MNIRITLVTIFALIHMCFYASFAFGIDQSQFPAIENALNGTLYPFSDRKLYSESKILKVYEDLHAPNRIPLTLVILKDSGWTQNEILDRLQRTREVFDQCKITFSPVMILEAKSSFGPTLNRDAPQTHLIDSEIEKTIGFLKPVIYFGSKELFDRNYGGYSWRKSSPGGSSDENKLNSVFIYREWAIKEDRSTGLDKPATNGFYEVMAHELAHVLMDLGHEESKGHIMSEMGWRTNLILETQCDRIRLNFLPNDI